MEDLFNFLVNFSQFEIYPIIFLVLLAAGFGLPVSEDVMLFVSALLAYYGHVNIYLTIVCCFLGILIGDSSLFFLGRIVGPTVIKKWPFNKFLTETRVVRAKNKLSHRGGYLIFSTRFMPGFRAPVFFSAGCLKLSYRFFIFFDAMAALISVPLLIGVVYYFADNIDSTIAHVRKAQGAVFFLALMVVIFLVVQWYIKFKKAKVV